MSNLHITLEMLFVWISKMLFQRQRCHVHIEERQFGKISDTTLLLQDCLAVHPILHIIHYHLR